VGVKVIAVRRGTTAIKITLSAHTCVSAQAAQIPIYKSTSDEEFEIESGYVLPRRLLNYYLIIILLTS
jgi:hypothetical protein